MALEFINNPLITNHNNKFTIAQKEFNNIPGTPIAYWIPKIISKYYSQTFIEEYCEVKKGLSTGNNSKYIRL